MTGREPFKPLLVRWTFGESPNCGLDGQAISLLKVSVRAARMLFPEARFVICHNNAMKWREELSALASESHAEMLDVKPLLPACFTCNSDKNSWWKYAPPRILLSGYELVLDNDVILWKRPPVLDEWLNSDALLGLGVEGDDCRPTLFYGDYAEQLRAVAPQLDLNAGLIGWPPGYSHILEKRPQLPPASSEYFHTEQGFTAWLFATFEGPKKLIPYTQVPLLHTMCIPPDELIQSCYGGHFCECNFGEMQYWRDSYEMPVRRFIEEAGERRGRPPAAAALPCTLADCE
ncbi:MAG TPA: hypothetical protein VGJ51_18430 [Candidatus Angelobacter sp.]|jgi:hypothetical protein